MSGGGRNKADNDLRFTVLEFQGRLRASSQKASVYSCDLLKYSNLVAKQRCLVAGVRMHS